MISGLLTYLVNDNLITLDEANLVAKNAAAIGQSITQYLVNNNKISSEVLLQCCAKHSGLPIFELNNQDNLQRFDDSIQPEIIFRYRLIPLKREQDCIFIGIADPTHHEATTAIRFHTGLQIRLMLVDENKLEKIINVYHKQHAQQALQHSLAKIKMTEPVVNDQQPIEKEDHEEPIIEFVNRLIKDAIEKQISDIHIEPFDAYYRIRFRSDGLLFETASLPKNLALRVCTRLKILAQMNIAERRLPQDGRIHYSREKKNNIDIRMNTCPTIFGEKIVLRLLDPLQVNLDINLLGFANSQLELFASHIIQPQGLILVTGPTGSGKTTTLYSALHYVNQIDKNIVTIEDPVEIELAGINQINIHSRIGLDFTTILRAILRQDPDIIMVGEIRDRMTAEICMQAAQTGHLVFATLHTNSALDTLIRLQSMQIESYHVTNSISLILAQRLLRKICRHCRGLQNNHCKACHQGYKGRIAIFECLPMTNRLAKLILASRDPTLIANHIKSSGYSNLWESAAEKINLGITDSKEVTRVLGFNSYAQSF